jgi:hypothetical protein
LGTVITFESTLVDGRRARGFFRQLPRASDAEAAITTRYWDEEDQEREPVLRAILSRPTVRAIAYPTLGHRDVLQVFLKDSEDQPVFASVLVSGTRLRDMLAQSSPIIEGFTLQVLPGEHLSMEGVRAALQAWVERCFPRLVLPSITVERWTGPEGLLQELLELLISQPTPEIPNLEQPSEVEPDPDIAQPPYEIAA